MFYFNTRRKFFILNLILALIILIIFYVFEKEETARRRWMGRGSRRDNGTRERKSHLFENECRIVWLEPEEPSMKKHVDHRRQISCARFTVEVLQRSEEDDAFRWTTQTARNMECMVEELTGGLRPNADSWRVGRTAMILPQSLSVFRVNADCFVITCFLNGTILYRRQFTGLKEETDELILEGKQSPRPVPQSSAFSLDSMSIALLVMDSTSRSQFMRHMPSSVERMQQMGFVFFQGYNKVGDNSAINLLPILAEQVKEGLQYDELDNEGDVQLARILPFSAKIDPDTIEFIWKSMKDSISMYSDDIMSLQRGVFHYPSSYFLRGYTSKPTTHYYRPFYTHLYKELNNKWKLCWDDRLLARDFVSTWDRFIKYNANRRYFAFNFVTSLTHDNGNFLELVDDYVSKRLRQFEESGALQNTLLVLMGDHGARVHPTARYTWAGKIEERSPFLAIYVPEGFRRQFSEQYERLKENSQRFISNFDLHETLLDIAWRQLGEQREGKRRGRSLFREIPRERNCINNNIIINFCLCMVDGSSELGEIHVEKDQLLSVLRQYIKDFECFYSDTLVCSNNLDIRMPNALVQVGLRNKAFINERINKRKPAQFLYIYQECIAMSKISNVLFTVQYRMNVALQEYVIVYPPMVQSADGEKCSEERFPNEYCNCIAAI